MTLSRALRKAATGLALLLPGTALAGTVVVTPMVPIHGVKAERLQDLFTLMSSELEFMDGVDEVVELDAPPASLTLSCLDSTKCLGAIAKENGGDMLLTGAVEERGTELLLDLVFYDLAKNRVVRRKTTTIPSDASKLIDRINPLLVEAVTGRAPAQAKVDPVSSADFEDDGDEVELEPTPAPKPTPPPTPAKITSSTTRAVDQKIVAPPGPAPKPTPPPDEDVGAVFTFGGDADDISFGDDAPPAPAYEEEEEVVAPRRSTSTRPAPAPIVEEEEEFEAPAPRRAAPVEDEIYDPYDPDEVEGEYDEPVRDLDTPRTSRPSGSSTAKSGKGSTGYRRVHIPLRAGYAHYGDFHFLAVGGEIQIRATKGLFIGIGAEPYFAKVCSTPPDNYAGAYADPAVCGKEGLYIRTVPLFPLNAGLLYRFLDKAVQPYAGADVVFANIGRADVYGDGVQRLTFAGGGRVRVGADFFVVKNFGFNIDAALGFWTGRGWQFVLEPRAQPTAGFLPRISAGITLAF